MTFLDLIQVLPNNNSANTSEDNTSPLYFQINVIMDGMTGTVYSDNVERFLNCPVHAINFKESTSYDPAVLEVQLGGTIVIQP